MEEEEDGRAHKEEAVMSRRIEENYVVVEKWKNGME